MATNIAPILANNYMAKLEKLLKDKCKTDIKLKWPILFKRFIDDGFGKVQMARTMFDTYVAVEFKGPIKTTSNFNSSSCGKNRMLIRIKSKHPPKILAKTWRIFRFRKQGTFILFTY